MIDSNAVMLALRNRMLSAVAATTGAVTLSATAAGYARTTGSFLADGFADGAEFLAAGFPIAGNNGYRVIESVSALNLITTTPTTAEAAGAGRTLSSGIPVGRAFENKTFNPTAGRPFIEEDFVPGGHSLRTMTAQGGWSDEDGLYVVKVYGLEGKGTGAIRKLVDAIKALFAPGTSLSASGVDVRMSKERSVTSGQILPQGNGWAVCVVTIQWMAFSQNVVAA